VSGRFFGSHEGGTAERLGMVAIKAVIKFGNVGDQVKEGAFRGGDLPGPLVLGTRVSQVLPSPPAPAEKEGREEKQEH